MRRCLPLFLGALLLASAGQVQASIVINGGFETGDLTGWIASGADWAIASTFTPHTGGFAFQGYDNSGFAILSQSFSTTPGTTYELDFWSLTDVLDPDNILRYQFDAGPIITVLQTRNYALTTDSFTASGATTTLNFLFETDIGTGVWQIDDVSVTQADPEPSSLALFGLGAMGMVCMRRKRR